MLSAAAVVAVAKEFMKFHVSEKLETGAEVDGIVACNNQCTVNKY